MIFLLMYNGPCDVKLLKFSRNISNCLLQLPPEEIKQMYTQQLESNNWIMLSVEQTIN